MDEDWFALGEEGLTFDGASICAMLQLSIRAADLPVTYTALLALMGRPLQTLILIKTANSGILPTFASSRHDLNFSCLQEKNPYAEPFMAPLGPRQSTKKIFSLAALQWPECGTLWHPCGAWAALCPCLPPLSYTTRALLLGPNCPNVAPADPLSPADGRLCGQ